MTTSDAISANEAYDKVCKRSCALLHFLLYGTTGLVLGIVLTGLIAWLLMPSLMLSVHKSKFSTVEETCTALKRLH